ncbi:MAG: sulfurtransferase [Pseudomonadota bacterium]
MSNALPGPLVETDWLADNLDQPDIRVLDCTVFLKPNEDKSGYSMTSGRLAWSEEHISGSAFADLAHELSDRTSQFGFTMPTAEQFASHLSRYGVSKDSRIILYDAVMNMWATRLWWMLRAFGCNNAAVLNGGWHKWKTEGRPVSNELPTYPMGDFQATPVPGLFAEKAEVLAATENDQICLLNALGKEPYTNKRIPGSLNVPAASLIDPETRAYLPLAKLRTMFEAVNATSSNKVITYCGGGIAATSDAFILNLLGVEDIAIYDGSMSEWLSDPALPTESG